MTRLPRTLDELRGLRGARWVRESTERQHDRFGPEAQREQQDRALERYGIADTGLAWVVAHSGRTIGTTEQWAAMMAAAGERYDVLVVGYVSRFARDLRTAVNARHELHERGAVLLFADERVLSSDEDQWETWARETVEAEAYSRRLAKRIREGYAAKFRRLADQAGPVPLGFTRTGPSATLAIDPATIGIPVAIFRRYASGVVTYGELAAEVGMEAGRVREILRNPVYNGWVRRHRRTDREERLPAPWRADPPVSDELWARVEQLRWERTRATGRRGPSRPLPLLSGLLWCPCGERIRANGTQGSPPKPMVIHATRNCPHWGDRRTWSAAFYEAAIAAQLASVDVGDAAVARIVSALASAPAMPVGMGRAQVQRRRRELALAHADGRLTTADYLAGLDALRTAEPDAPPATERLSADEVVRELRGLPEAWALAEGHPDIRRAMVRAAWERIEVVPGRFVMAHPTREAQRMGLPLAMRERVAVVSREGARLTTTTIMVPIAGRKAWERAIRERSA